MILSSKHALAAITANGAFHTIDLPSSGLNQDLRTWTDGGKYNGYMNGTQTFNGVPFTMQTNGSGYNVAWVTTQNPFSLNQNVTYSKTVTIPTNIYGATKVFSLINTAWGTHNQNVGYIKFIADDGSSYNYDLIVGSNVRDHYGNNSISSSYTTLNVVGDNSGSHLDLQAFSLPASFASKTLTSIEFRTIGSVNNTGIPFLAGLTADAAALPATQIAHYNFEEDMAWNGTVNELKDSAGYSGGPFDGHSIGSPKPSASDSDPALGDSTSGTCGYATLPGPSSNAGAFSIDNLPVSTTSGNKTSVSFWMYWDGTSYRMPIGWYHYDIYISGGYIGFNTANSDIYGVSSSGLSNGWHHIAAVFTNGNVTSNQLYIDGTKMTLNQVMGTPGNWGSDVVQSTLQVGGWTSNTGYRFSGRIDELKVYNGAMTQAQVTADYTATHTCLLAYELLAEYHLDETSWTGTSNEVQDTAGYSGGPFGGQAVGSPLPSSNFASPAIPGTTSGTCGYAELDGPTTGGGAFTFNNLPLDTSNGAKNSVSFWMYWDGSDQVVPVSANDYGILIYGGNIGFSTDGTDLYGTNASGLANGWHHIAAVFTQGDILGNKLYIDGNLQVLSQVIAAGSSRIIRATFDADDYSTGNRTPLSPWSTDNSGGTVEIGYNTWYNVTGGTRKVMELEQHDGDASNLKATISTNIGDTIYLSFDHAESQSYSYHPSDINLYIDNQFIGRVDRNSQSFAYYEYSGTTNSSSTVVELRGTSTNGIGVILDDIVIETEGIAANLNSNVQFGGLTSNTSMRFMGRIDEIKFYRGEIIQSQVTADYNATHSCPSYVVSVDAHEFNCIAEQEASPNTGHLYMQVAGQPFNIKVVALKSDGTAETDYSAASDKTVTIEFLDQTQASTPITFNDGTNVTSKSLTFTSSNTTGVVTVSNLSIANAYRNLRCRITDTNQSPTLTATSSDNFSVRPLEFTLSSSANADNTGTNANATPTIVAGNTFTVYANTNTPGYNYAPQFDNTKRNAHAGAPKKGTLTGSFLNANSATGNAIGSNFVYQEVGYVRINTEGVYDTTFTAVDSGNNDCIDSFSNVASAGKYGCKFRNNTQSGFFGRFIPYHFDVGSGSRVTTGQCNSSFTYYGQDGLSTAFEIRAENTSGSLLRNYDGAYAKLDVNTWTDTSSGTGLRFAATNLPSGVTLSASATAPTGSWDEGLATVVAKHQLSRPVSPVAEVSLALEMDAIDSDGVGVDDGTPESINQSADSVFRYGKLSMKNAYGSELQPLSIPVEAQYWDGATYQKNTLDSCSVISPINVTMDNYQSNLVACESSLTSSTTMSAGELTLSLSEPGNGNSGSVTLTSNLTTASGSTCVPNSTSATSANLPWFGASNPSAKATFGLHKTPVIYIRENF